MNQFILKYADFKGRTRRQDYFLFVILYVLVGFSLQFICGLIAFVLSRDNKFSLEISKTVIVVFQLFMFIPQIAINTRRMHDTGRSGWYQLIPIYNLILCFAGGDRYENKYGPDPKEVLKKDSKLVIK